MAAEPRFYISDVDEELDGQRNVNGWYAVVDEEAGGEIAYFNTLEDAQTYRDAKASRGR
jgi:hypothetical protein